MLTLGLVFQVAAADWPRLGGPEGTGISPETGLLRGWPPEGPQVLWSLALGQGYGGPAVFQGLVYMLDREGQIRDVLRCVDLATGQERWHLDLEAPGQLPYPGSRNVPTVEADLVFAVSPFGALYAVDRKAGKLLWTHHLVTDFKDPTIDRDTPSANRQEALRRTQLPMWGLTQAPLLYRDLVIVAPQTEKVGLVAYEKTTGRLRWQSGYLGRNWYSHVSPCLARLGGRDQIIMLAQPSDPEKWPPAIVSGTSPETGEILWQMNTPAAHKIPMPQPVPVGEDRLFITGGYRLGCFLMQVSRDHDQWRASVMAHNKNAAGHIHSPILYREHLYLSSAKEYGALYTGLVCLDTDAKPCWQTGPDTRFDNGPMLIADGMVFILHGKTGELQLYEAVPEAARLLASAKVLDGKDPWAPMALADGKLLVRDMNLMKCLEVKKTTK